MPPQMHADAGRFRRGRAKSDQATTQKHKAGMRQEATAHDGLLHDFVLVPVGVAHSESGFDRSGDIQGRQDPSFSGSNRCQWRYRPGPPHSIRLQAQPNVDFPALPPKAAAGNPKIDRPNRTGTMNPVKALENHGQAVWLDFLARGFVAKGDLQALIDTDGVKGVTSNPSIFEKAIGSSDEYDGAIGRALKAGDRPVADLFESLAIEDIQNAADVLRPVYDRLNGEDGFVSLEVSPYLAMDTKGTIAEAERLSKDVKRQNLMVKVPATPEGLPAIEHLIGEG